MPDLAPTAEQAAAIFDALLQHGTRRALTFAANLLGRCVDRAELDAIVAVVRPKEVRHA